jgi:steroid delta-isomerase-like uncharacterized protein
MSAQQNTTTIEAAFEAWNTRDWNAFTSFVSDQGVVVNEATGQRLQGHEGWRQFWDLWATAFPDNRIVIRNLVADERTVAVEATFEGTQTGPFHTPSGDIPASGRAIAHRYAGFYTLDDGVTVETHIYLDILNLLHQIGVGNEAPTS